MVKLNLVSVGNNKIKVIKVISEDLGYSLNDAKTIVDNVPTELEVDPEKVEKLIEDLESAGANVSYSQSDAGSLTTLETSILSDEVGTQVLSEEERIDTANLSSLGRNETLAVLDSVLKVTERLDFLQSKIQEVENEIQEMYAKAEEIFNDIPTFVFIIALIGLIVGFISGNSFLGRVLLGAIIGIGVLWLVDKIVKAFTVDKRTKAKNDYINAHLPQLNQRIADIQSQMVDLVNSEDGLWAIDVVGDEFFCTPFVKELMSYLSSRRADNLKEAIQQYDLHTHNFNMESMQADIKDASERTAIEAAKQTEYAKQTEKNTKATANAAKANAVINYATYKNVKKIRKSLK